MYPRWAAVASRNAGQAARRDASEDSRGRHVARARHDRQTSGRRRAPAEDAATISQLICLAAAKRTSHDTTRTRGLAGAAAGKQDGAADRASGSAALEDQARPPLCSSWKHSVVDGGVSGRGGIGVPSRYAAGDWQLPWRLGTAPSRVDVGADAGLRAHVASLRTAGAIRPSPGAHGDERTADGATRRVTPWRAFHRHGLPHAADWARCGSENDKGR
ncbi:hypothetical protein WOLCODRAFT_148582 [Wolfiporia cocos MD-104 SS10]|uniref:Uncharacterized protein n=1 Tax=Wolfiporia cocos (strain MD-104) TaxID=742152 RepID=A0A2H3J7M5_WOLCO|nr:hypothetical protein WOLCODRAFT_148582 [Wolfiporia cocos MD-104 SS10]